MAGLHYSFEISDDILRVKTTGKDEDLEEVKAYGMEIVQKCLENDITKVLADERDLEYALSTVDTFNLSQFLSRNVPRLGMAAFVCPEEYLNDAKFFENTVSNRGLRIRVFTSVEEAENWLQN